MELQVESFALRKQLAREIYQKYNTLNFYSEHKKGNSSFFVKKGKKREEYKPKEEVKKDSNPEESKGIEKAV